MPYNTEDAALYSMPPSLIVAGSTKYDLDGDEGSGTWRRNLSTLKSFTNIFEDTSNSGYNEKAIMSLDGIFRPASLGGSGGLPRLIKSVETGTWDTGDSATNIVTGRHLNFLTNPTGFDFSELSLMHTGDKTHGHDIDAISRRDLEFYSTNGTGTGESYSLTMPFNITGSGNEYTSFTDYADDYRFPVLRGPIWMQSWGYTTDGKPVPNAADIEADMLTGVYKTEGAKNLFYKDWLKRSDLWPVAPLDIRLNIERGVWEAGSGGGGFGNSTKEFVLIVKDLNGYQTNNLESYPTNAKVINRVWNTELSAFIVNDEDEIYDVIPVETTTILMSDEGCCGSSDDGTGSFFPGLYFSSPIAGNNFITESELSSVTISGGGVAPTSYVEIDVPSVGTFNSSSHFSINADGTFSLPVSFAAYNGLNTEVNIGGQETLIGEASPLAARYITVFVGDTYTGPDLTWFNSQPNRPSLFSTSDTGRSATDNWTADDNPTITISSSNQGLGAGHGYVIYVDDIVFDEDYFVSSPVTAGYSTTYTFTGLDLADGVHSIQWQEKYQDGFSGGGDVYGPISNPLWLLIDSAETGEPSLDVFEEADITYGRYGQIETINGVKFLTSIDSCNVPLTPFLSDRAAGYITAMGTASSDFDESDSSVSILGGSVVISNPTDDADPAAPTSLDLTGTNYTGLIGDQLKMRYNFGTWEIRGVRNV